MAEVDETPDEPDEQETPGAPETDAEPVEGEDEPEAARVTETPAGDDEQPQGGMTEKQLEARAKRIDTANATHARKISDILGEDATSLIECPLCAWNIAGWVIPQMPPPEIVHAVSQALGLPDPHEYKAASDARICDDCGGRGSVLTGSLVEAHRTKPCRACKGTGWVPVGVARENGNLADAEIHPAFTQEQVPDPEEDPTLAAYKKLGYTIVPPMGAPAIPA